MRRSWSPGLYLFVVGSYFWVLLTALGVGMGWAVAVFFNVLAGPIFLFCHPDKAARPMFLHTLSWILLLGYGFHVLH